MKVLAVNGSAKKNGRTGTLLGTVVENLKNLGAEVETIHLVDKKIENCKSYCAEGGTTCQYPCSINDDMAALIEKIKEADCLVLASPTYWYSMSGLMKNFIDRLTVCDMTEPPILDGKVCATLATALADGSAGVTLQMTAPLTSMGGIMVPYNDVYRNGEYIWRSDLGVEPEKRLAKNLINLAKLVKEKQGNWFKSSEG